MKKFSSGIIAVLAVIIALVTAMTITSYAAENIEIADNLTYNVSVNDGSAIHTQIAKDGKRYLFLPSGADLASFKLDFDDEVFSNVTLSNSNGSIAVTSGVPFDMTKLVADNSIETEVTVSAVTAAGTQIQSFSVMKSANVRSLFLTSSDPVNYGRAYVDQDKNNKKAKGSAVMLSSDGTVDYDGTLSQIKGRGNTTFTHFVKKPYQIKLDKKFELLEGAGKSKTWVLLANMADPSLVRNAISLDIAVQMGITYTTPYESLDLYYDGEYRGTYMLTEKVQLDSSRIDISNTDDLNEEANIDNPAYEAEESVNVSLADPSKQAEEGAKGSIKYINGLTDPELPEGASHHAYLLEMEQPVRYPDEISGFVSNRGKPMITKNPEYLTKNQGIYIANKWQEFEDAVFSKDGYNAKTGKYYYEYCDLDSLVTCYVINELSKNPDYFFSSTYFYLPEDEDIFYCGPLWDYDIAYGISWDVNRTNVDTKAEYFCAAAKDYGEALMKISSFREKAKAMMQEGGEAYNIFKSAAANGGLIDTLTARVSASAKMNSKLYDITNQNVAPVKLSSNVTFENSAATLKSFINTRLDWLNGQMSGWNGDDYTILTKAPEPKKSFIQRILDFFMSILDWIQNLFK